MKKLSVNIALASAAAALLASAPAQAGTATGTLTSTLTVTTTCTIANGGNALLDFGTIPAKTLTDNLDADTGATLQLDCDGTVSAPTLRIAASANRSGSDRALKATVAGTDLFVPYRLFTTAGRTTEYAIDTAVAIPGGFSAAGTNTVTIYGRIPTGTAIDQGSYTDMVNLEVTY